MREKTSREKEKHAEGGEEEKSVHEIIPETNESQRGERNMIVARSPWQVTAETKHAQSEF